MHLHFIRWLDDLICISRRHLDALECLLFGARLAALFAPTTSNTKTSLGIIRGGISRCCPENVKALFTLLDAAGTFTPLDQFKKCGQIFSEQYLGIPLPAQCKIGRSQFIEIKFVKNKQWRLAVLSKSHEIWAKPA
ncbi:hypothetical protein OAM00_00510 [Verrucomicrobia bacterium]|nr:hypothetical protein [Verrucomicrobiota bacterium]MDA7665167.1 hypothetical protein [Verrucomicrobiota bacterium]MDC0299242.1 hypothetical protein [Verrucomicrobiota bacterium]